MQDPAGGLDCYLVGGVVRDELLGRPVEDRDWVVVGADPERMIALGFRPVGRDFPVFLHPQTGEQYALARTERKSAPGYRGFVVHAAPDVTLEDDLRRRDLTINAIARRPDGALIDPFGGVADLERRVLRHVSPAFVEDPVRVLRVARFAARFADLGFTVDAATMTLMRELADSGELDALTAERVWSEIQRALGEERPSLFFTTLRDCGALARLLPEIDALFGVPQQPRHHPEIDSGVHTMTVVDMAARLGADGETRFAALVHDLGKALTPAAELPAHRRHEQRGLAPIERLCDRLRVPRSWRQLALAVCRNHLLMHRLGELRPSTIVDLLGRIDAFRHPDIVARFALACEADHRGRGGRAAAPYPQRALFERCAQAALGADLGGVESLPDDGERRAGFVRERRIEAVRAALADAPRGGRLLSGNPS